MPQLLIGRNEVHVWTICLEHDRKLDWNVLSPDEKYRASQFQVAGPRQQYVSSRIALREILGGHLGVPPDRVQFQYGPCGKPELADSGVEALHFNVSHSGNFAVIGVSPIAPLGIDIEAVRDLVNLHDLVRHVFSPWEQTQFTDLPYEIRQRAYFTGWTRKEAVVKSMGVGLQLPLQAVEVSISPNDPPRVVRVDNGSESPRDWRIWALRAPAGYEVSLAMRSNFLAIDLLQFTYVT